jgi:hypothetical protein
MCSLLFSGKTDIDQNCQVSVVCFDEELQCLMDVHALTVINTVGLKWSDQNQNIVIYADKVKLATEMKFMWQTANTFA